MRYLSLSLILLILLSCNRKPKVETIPETRTSGTTTLLVDESFARILDDQVTVFQSDYPNAKVSTILGNENEIMPKFLNREVKMIVLSRMLTKDEEDYYKQKQIPIDIDRFAIDGIALITNRTNVDTNITVQEVYAIMKGENKSKKLVFDNANSSTIRYFIDSARVKTLPESGVYTLTSNNDVIKYVAEHKDYIGVVGVNWLLEDNKDVAEARAKVTIMGVKNLKGKKGDDGFYQPIQKNLINGVYPFLRNVYIVNCEGRDGLGTGFANWLNSPRGQLIVLKSGLGPHETVSREFNLK